MVDLQALKLYVQKLQYKKLQAIAKKLGLRANRKKEILIQNIQEEVSNNENVLETIWCEIMNFRSDSGDAALTGPQISPSSKISTGNDYSNTYQWDNTLTLENNDYYNRKEVSTVNAVKYDPFGTGTTTYMPSVNDELTEAVPNVTIGQTTYTDIECVMPFKSPCYPENNTNESAHCSYSYFENKKLSNCVFATQDSAGFSLTDLNTYPKLPPISSWTNNRSIQAIQDGLSNQLPCPQINNSKKNNHLTSFHRTTRKPSDSYNLDVGLVRDESLSCAQQKFSWSNRKHNYQTSSIVTFNPTQRHRLPSISSPQSIKKQYWMQTSNPGPHSSFPTIPITSPQPSKNSHWMQTPSLPHRASLPPIPMNSSHPAKNEYWMQTSSSAQRSSLPTISATSPQLAKDEYWMQTPSLPHRTSLPPVSVNSSRPAKNESWMQKLSPPQHASLPLMPDNTPLCAEQNPFMVPQSTSFSNHSKLHKDPVLSSAMSNLPSFHQPFSNEALLDIDIDSMDIESILKENLGESDGFPEHYLV